MTLFSMISIAIALFVGGSILLELIKIRKALEYTAYKKEVHEVIETSYHNDEEEHECEQCEDEHHQHHHHHHHDKHKDDEGKKPIQRIYRKTKIKVVSEDE